MSVTDRRRGVWTPVHASEHDQGSAGRAVAVDRRHFGAPETQTPATDLAHVLAADVAVQANRATPALVVGIVAVVFLQHGVLDDRALALWVVIAVAHLVRHVITSRREMRFEPATSTAVARSRLIDAVANHTCFGLAWGSQALIAGLAGSTRATWTACIVSLAVLAMYVASSAASRLRFAVGLVAVLVPTIAGILLAEPPDARLAVAAAGYGVICVIVHEILHRSLVDAYRTKLDNVRLVGELQRQLSERDPTTGLRNRTAFSRELTLLAQAAAETDGEVVIAVGNLRRLATVNELHGEAVGTALLVAIAERLRRAELDGYLSARVGGDEFAVAVVGSPGEDRHARSLFHDVAAEPVTVEGLALPISWRVTESVVTGTTDPLDTLSAATSRLRALRNREPKPAAGVPADSVGERRALAERLDPTLATSGIEPWFQPIVAAGSRRIVGWEALVRWPQPDGEVLLPDRFLPLVAAGGRQQDLLDLLVRRSARFLQDLAAHTGAAPALHLNLTPDDLRSSGTADRLVSVFGDAGLDLDQLVVELTEQDILELDDIVRDNLTVLTAAGAHVAVDDFGTGYSSLSHLLDLPSDHLKIDQRFIAGLLADAQRRTLVRGVIGLAAGMGLRTTAEGVETAAQADALAALGCDELQGFLIAPAMPAPEAIVFATRHAEVVDLRAAATTAATGPDRTIG